MKRNDVLEQSGTTLQLSKADSVNTIKRRAPSYISQRILQKRRTEKFSNSAEPFRTVDSDDTRKY